MKQFLLKTALFFVLFFTIASFFLTPKIFAGCYTPALCDASAPGECSLTCNGGQPCKVNDGGWYNQCVTNTDCRCYDGADDIGSCAANAVDGDTCGISPYTGICGCDSQTTCEDVFICEEVSYTPCCIPAATNPCGNGVINSGETCSSCPEDVGACPAVCGDGACNGSESCSTCSSDCGACSGGGGGGGGQVCGNGSCGGTENCSNCSADCGSCTSGPSCGNGVCGSGESCSTCAADCGVCASEYCGNGICSAVEGEDCSSCSADCGSCATTFCGDAACNGFETCGTCAGDCGACPADVAWWQAQGGPAYAYATSGTAIQSMVPSTCTAPTCTRALVITDAAQTPLSDGFALSNGGAIISNGYSTERQPNVEVITTNLTKFRESYDFFYREYSLGANPPDDFATNAGNATKPTAGTLPASGRDAFFHNSETNGVFTIQERWQVAADEQIVILIQGDMDITNPNGYDDLITVDPGGSLVFIVSGEINIDATVGNASVANINPNIEGVFIADGTIFIESTGDTATEKRFVGAGSFVSWTTISMDRDLGTTNNQNIPAEFFTFRPDFVENVPEHLARPRYVWQETN